LPPFNFDDPGLYWIFRNMDFDQWKSDRSEALWLSAPPEHKLHQVASHIVDLAKDPSNPQHCVLYFFCSAAAGKRLGSVVFGTFLHQLVRRLDYSQRAPIIAVFLRTLLNAYLARDDVLKGKRWWRENYTPNQIIEKVVASSLGKETVEALKAVLELEQLDIRELSIIIDGLDKAIENHETEFIQDLCALIFHVQRKPWRVKVLLTSRPQDDLKRWLKGLRCIEYDKERKGLINILSPTFRMHPSNKECRMS
jgi:hypothetical protein